MPLGNHAAACLHSNLTLYNISLLFLLRIRLGAHVVLRAAQLAVTSLLGHPAQDPICPCPSMYTKGMVVYRIGRSMFETEVLPLGLAKYAEHVDEVSSVYGHKGLQTFISIRSLCWGGSQVKSRKSRRSTRAWPVPL